MLNAVVEAFGSSMVTVIIRKLRVRECRFDISGINTLSYDEINSSRELDYKMISSRNWHRRIVTDVSKSLK